MPLSQLPGAALINTPKLPPGVKDTSASLVLDAATISGPYNVPEQQQLITYTTPIYYDEATRVAYPFARTLRMRRGGSYSIKVTNNMVQPENATLHNFFGNPGFTNLHTHGLFDAPGVWNQLLATAPTDQVKGDNIFYTIYPRATSASKPSTVTFTGNIPAGHLPGLHWAHPHQ